MLLNDFIEFLPKDVTRDILKFYSTLLPLCLHNIFRTVENIP